MTEYRPFVQDIPVRPREAPAAPMAAGTRPCAVKGCTNAGDYRAPTSPTRMDEYQWLCLGHVREHNSRWDYFRGMSAADVERYLKDGQTGHRPTWSIGVNRAKAGTNPFSRLTDPLGIFARGQEPNRPEPPRGRHIGTLQRQALDTLDLDETASLKDVKARYKELVKQFHPDANGGDRSCEDRLKRVIRAYRILRASNFE